MSNHTTANIPTYSREDLLGAFHKTGIKTGDLVFVHVCLDSLGTPAFGTEHGLMADLLLSVLRQVVGDAGTILVPTYTFSFCRQELFDVQKSLTPGGPWSTSTEFLERFRTLPGAIRSRDPIHSVAGIGPMAEELLADLPNTCFGDGSIFHRLRRANGKICTIGTGLHEATFLHHIEETIGVPFRFKKLFTGQIRDGGTVRKEGWIYYVRLLADNSLPDASRLEKEARASGACKSARIGKGEILTIGSCDYFDLATRELKKDPWFTAKGPPDDPVKLEEKRVGAAKVKVNLAPNATMAQMISELWHLPRDIVSDGYDTALEALAAQLRMMIHEYPSGTECWTWLVPEKWTCYEAYLETIDGRRLFSYADNPLHVVSYSLPFRGEVTRQELFQHLHVHPSVPEAIPFIFKYYEREWGLCCSQALKEKLTDERYRVVIDTDFSFGTLKVGEVVVPGDSEECIVLCAHLCHPGMVNDDLAGVVVGIEVMRALRRRSRRRYTYRFLIVPETIGSLAFLSHNEHLIPNMKGGLFLEMLGVEQPHALQRSFIGNSEVDECFELTLRNHDFYAWVGDFRTVIDNDDRQFNAPGVRVPMLSLSRVLPSSAPVVYFREYHSSLDNPDLVSMRRLEESRELILRMIDTLEHNWIPRNRFKGEPFLSRYGLHIDWYRNREGNRALTDILHRIDGTRSLAQIANDCGISFEAAKNTVDELCRVGLVEYL